MKLVLQIWRQSGPAAPGTAGDGKFVRYEVDELRADMSFLEMLDILNERLTLKGEEPVAFEHDCREGICGSCGMMINGQAHGPQRLTTACQLHLRTFEDGQEIYIEPWRARAFPVLKDLVVDRGALDRIIQAGGFVGVGTGSAPEANSLPVAKEQAEKAMDAAQCIGCGACVAACPNRSAMLFTAAKVAHLASLPQGQAERYRRVRNMLAALDDSGFGGCSNYGECQDACPKGISILTIAQVNRDYLRAQISGEGAQAGTVAEMKAQ